MLREGVYAYSYFGIYAQGKALIGREECCIATVGFFLKRSLVGVQVFRSFCLEPPFYRGVAYHSAAKTRNYYYESFSLSQIFPKSFSHETSPLYDS